VKLEKCKKKLKMMSIKCDVKCDNIVKENIIDLTNKNSSNPILIKEKMNPIENIQNNNNIKDNVIGPSSKNIPHHVFNKKKKQIWVVSKPFNGIS